MQLGLNTMKVIPEPWYATIIPALWRLGWEDYHIFKANLNWFYSETLSPNKHTEAWGWSSVIRELVQHVFSPGFNP